MWGLPDDVFEAEDEFEGEILTVGNLAQAHVDNTMALRRANNKLITICIAAGRCSES